MLTFKEYLVEEERDNVAFLNALKPDELNDILRGMLSGVQFLASKYSTSSLRALKVREMYKTHAGKQQIVNDWVKAGAPFPILDGMGNTSAGPYKHQGEEFMAWESDYLRDSEEEYEKQQKIKAKGSEAWKEYTDAYLADIPQD